MRMRSQNVTMAAVGRRAGVTERVTEAHARPHAALYLEEYHDRKVGRCKALTKGHATHFAKCLEVACSERIRGSKRKGCLASFHQPGNLLGANVAVHPEVGD